MAVDPKAGPELADMAETEALVDVALEADVNGREELLAGALGALANLTFYDVTEACVRQRHDDLVELSLAGLVHTHVETRLEASRLLCNIARRSGGGQAEHEHGGAVAATASRILLEYDPVASEGAATEREVAIQVCGALANACAAAPRAASGAAAAAAAAEAGAVRALADCIVGGLERSDGEVAVTAARALANVLGALARGGGGDVGEGYGQVLAEDETFAAEVALEIAEGRLDLERLGDDAASELVAASGRVLEAVEARLGFDGSGCSSDVGGDDDDDGASESGSQEDGVSLHGHGYGPASPTVSTVGRRGGNNNALRPKTADAAAGLDALS
ncbi:hypothetical protein HK405_015660 [Cladochytrium tenue]|nr:hypothetical protein HK405_015660 [Cladochytrium tenue]